MLTIILISVIVVLVIGLGIAIFFIIRERDNRFPNTPCPPCERCTPSYTYLAVPNTEFNVGANVIYTDTSSLTSAQARCSSDERCLYIIPYQGTNYYYSSEATQYITDGPTTLFIKQEKCNNN